MPSLPTGTVTFLFTDIEGSTRLWEEHPEAMKAALARHDEILRAAIEDHGGYVFTTAGDAFCAAFRQAPDALIAALSAQLEMLAEKWGDLDLRVRMGLHTGDADERAGDYFGPVVNRAARLMSAANGSQVLVSRASRDIVETQLADGVGLADLGEHRLRDLDRTEHVFQVTHAELPEEFPALVTLAEVPNNLPVQATSFVGRDREMIGVERLLRTSRLVTLTGAGGSGKTRLAVELARQLLEEFLDGVWFIDLAPLSDGALMPEVVASTLRVPERPGHTTEQLITAHLKHYQTLMILDNCEHLIDEAAALASSLLKSTNRLRLLATSREPLQVQGETRSVVSVMIAPPEDTEDHEQIARYDAVRLFVQRGEAVSPGFRITRGNAGAVGRICRRLDGLPLALELAASRLAVFQPHELLERLEDRFQILASGQRDRPERHQTLQATLDWSYQLLQPVEQMLMNRLSVFRDGFDLDGVESICSSDDIDRLEVADLLMKLAAQSLVSVISRPAGNRFDLLETVRDYAASKLEAGGAASLVRQRHAVYFAGLAEDAFGHMRGPQEAEWEERLEDNHSNLRQALIWHLDAGQTQEGMAMAGALYRFWAAHWQDYEGLVWLRRFLEADGTPSSARARALLGAGTLTASNTDAEDLLRESVALYRRFGPDIELAAALNNLADRIRRTADGYEEAAELFQESLELFRSADYQPGVSITTLTLAELATHAFNRPDEAAVYADESLEAARRSGSHTMLAISLRMVADSRRLAGDLTGAKSAALECLQLAESADDPTTSEESHPSAILRAASAWAENVLAAVALDSGDMTGAYLHNALALRALDSLPDTGFDHTINEEALRTRGLIELSEGNAELALRLFAAAHAIRQEADTELFPDEQETQDIALRRASQKLDSDGYTRSWDEGIGMNAEQAIAYALDQLED